MTYRRSLGPRDADVGEPALLLQLVGLGQRPGVREHALLDADRNTTGNSRPLAECSVIRTTWSSTRSISSVSATSDDLLEELVDAGELAGRPDELAEVLEPPSRLDGVLGLQLGEVAGASSAACSRSPGPVGLAVGRRARHRAELVEQGDERRRCHGPPDR